MSNKQKKSKNNNFKPFSLKETTINLFFFGNGNILSWIVPCIITIILSAYFVSEWHNEENQIMLQNCKTIETAVYGQTDNNFFFNNMTCLYTKTVRYMDLYYGKLMVEEDTDIIQQVNQQLNQTTKDDVVQQVYDLQNNFVKKYFEDTMDEDSLIYEMYNINMMAEQLRIGSNLEYVLTFLYCLVVSFTILRIGGAMYLKISEKEIN